MSRNPFNISMDIKNELVKEINTSIERVLHKLIDIFTFFKTRNTKDYKELSEVVCTQRNLIQVSDLILHIYSKIILLKYTKYEKNEMENKIQDFDIEVEYNNVVKELLNGFYLPD